MPAAFRLPLIATLLACTPNAFAAELPADMPQRKSGLWEVQATMAGMPMPLPAAQICVDQQTDRIWEQQGRQHARRDCQKIDIRREGNRYLVDTVCKVQQSTATTHGYFEGAFDTHYRGEMQTTFAPPLHGREQIAMQIDGRWLGECKPGQKPGEVSVPALKGMDVQQLQQMINQYQQH